MAELEIHHEGHESDPFGRTVGVLAAIIAVFLAAVTIQSHRSHTSAVIHRTDANDKWAFYQAKSIKKHTVEIAAKSIELLAPKSEAGEKQMHKYEQEAKRYEKEGEEIQEQAKQFEEVTEQDEQRALRYDWGEGLLELGLVLSSLYFIAKKKLFPVIGVTSAVAGGLIAATALFMK
jgi:hypothetical protein